jgi:hypothetical protein
MLQVYSNHQAGADLGTANDKKTSFGSLTIAAILYSRGYYLLWLMNCIGEPDRCALTTVLHSSHCPAGQTVACSHQENIGEWSRIIMRNVIKSDIPQSFRGPVGSQSSSRTTPLQKWEKETMETIKIARVKDMSLMITFFTGHTL